jgi:hypothetical protein
LISEAQHLEERIANLTTLGTSFGQWLSQRNATLKRLDQNAAEGVTEATIALRQKLMNLMSLADGTYADLETELKSLNWELVEHYFGERVSPRSTVYAMVVLDADQSTRWAWFLWASVFFSYQRVSLT